MENQLTNRRSEVMVNIIDFYKIQPGVQQVHVEKIEEYLLVLNSFFQEAIEDLEFFLNSEQIVSLIDVLDVLNTYINSILEEFKKIFSEDVFRLELIHCNQTEEIHEVQMLELLQNFNGREENRWKISSELQNLEEFAFTNEFYYKFVELAKTIICRINSELITKVDDLI